MLGCYKSHSAKSIMRRSVEKSEETIISVTGYTDVKKKVKNLEQVLYKNGNTPGDFNEKMLLNRTMSSESGCSYVESFTNKTRSRRHKSIADVINQPKINFEINTTTMSSLSLNRNNLEKFQSMLTNELKEFNFDKIQQRKDRQSNGNCSHGSILESIDPGSTTRKSRIPRWTRSDNGLIENQIKISKSTHNLENVGYEKKSRNVQSKSVYYKSAQNTYVHRQKSKFEQCTSVSTENIPEITDKFQKYLGSRNIIVCNDEAKKDHNRLINEQFAENPIYENVNNAEKLHKKNFVELEKQNHNVNPTHEKTNNDPAKELNKENDEESEMQNPTYENINNFTSKEFCKEYFGEFEMQNSSEDHYTVEAFNNKGNELHLTYYEIQVTEDYDDKGSDIVFKTTEDNEYIELENNQHNCPISENSISIEEINTSPSIEDEESTTYEVIHFEEGLPSSSKTEKDVLTIVEITNSPELEQTTSQASNEDDSNSPSVETDKVDSIPVFHRRKKKEHIESKLNEIDENKEHCRAIVDPPPEFRDNVTPKGKRNTIFDNQGNIRIEIIENPEVNPLKQNALKRDNSIINKTKIDYVIEEIISSEEVYIEGLKLMLQEYKPFLIKRSPHNLSEIVPAIFGNLDKIYTGTKKFHKDLLSCNNDILKVGETFLRHEKLFRLYPKYTKHKLQAEDIFKSFKHIAQEKQKLLGEKLDLPSYLLTPIQRLAKYQLLINQILKQLKRDNSEHAEVFEKAYELIKTEMRKGNDSLAVASIKESSVDLNAKGSFLMRDLFTVRTANSSKKIEYMVFLFDKIVVFTKVLTKEYFLYQDSIEMSNLSLVTSEFDKYHFQLTDFTKSKKVKDREKSKYTYILEASSEKCKTSWTQEIEKFLWMQLTQAKEEILKRHGLDKVNSKKVPGDQANSRRRSSSSEQRFHTAPNRHSNSSTTKADVPERHKSFHEFGDERKSHFYV